MNTKVYFIGAGPGDPELITVKGQRLIREADLVLYAGSLVPQAIVAQAKASARVVDSAPLNLQETHALLMETVRQDGVAARVHTGDPSIYGAVREQAMLLEQEGVSYEIIPGVTASLAAAAAARLSFTIPEISQSLIITRLGGRTPVPEAEQLQELARHRCALAVYLSGGDPETLADQLRTAGLPGHTPVVAAHKVGWPGQQIIHTTLDQLNSDSLPPEMHRQTVFLILPGEDGSERFSKLYDHDFKHGFRP